MPYLNDVVQEFDDGLATAEDIDTALRAGPRLPAGPPGAARPDRAGHARARHAAAPTRQPSTRRSRRRRCCGDGGRGLSRQQERARLPHPWTACRREPELRRHPRSTRRPVVRRSPSTARRPATRSGPRPASSSSTRCSASGSTQRCVRRVLTGAGEKFFCIGGEHDEVDLDSTTPRSCRSSTCTRLIDTIAKPVIAAVNGFAVGGGNVLHTVCDLTVAADNARVPSGRADGRQLRRRLRHLVPRGHHRSQAGQGDVVPQP